MGDARRPALLLVCAQAFTAASAFGVSLLAATVMAPAERGELALWLQIGYLITTIAMLGLERPLSAHAEGSFAGLLDLSASLLRWPAIALGAAFAIAIAAAVVDGFDPLLLLVGLSAAFAGLSIWGRAARVAYIVSQSWKPYLGSVVLVQIVILVGALLLVLTDVDSVLAWAALYTASAAAVLVYLVGVRRRSGDLALELDTPRGTLVRSGIMLLPASFGNTAMLRSDRLLLPLLSSTSQLGLYVIVATATELASWPIQQYADASLRRWRLDRRSSPARQLGFVALGCAVGGAIAAVAAAACWLAIELWLPAYGGAVVLLPPLVLAASIYSGTRLQQAFLIAGARARSASAVEILGMSAALIMYVVLIPEHGALGAAWGSAVGYALALVAGIAFALLGRSRR